MYDFHLGQYTFTTKELMNSRSSLAGSLQKPLSLLELCVTCAHPHIPMNILAHLSTPTHNTDVNPRTSDICENLHTPAHTRTHRRTPTHPHIPMNILAHLSTPKHTDVLRSALLFGFKTTEILVLNSEKPTEAN